MTDPPRVCMYCTHFRRPDEDPVGALFRVTTCHRTPGRPRLIGLTHTCEHWEDYNEQRRQARKEST